MLASEDKINIAPTLLVISERERDKNKSDFIRC